SRVKREFGGCLGNVIEHKIARKAHTLRAWRDFGARGFKNAERFFIEEIHADFFQHLEGRIVDRLDLVGTENLNRLVRILIASPRRLLDAASAPPLAPPSCVPRHCRSVQVPLPSRSIAIQSRRPSVYPGR